MNAKKSRLLRRMARFEMSADAKSVDRELVVARVRGHDRVVNEPNSNRAMYRNLKFAYLTVKPR